MQPPLLRPCCCRHLAAATAVAACPASVQAQLLLMQHSSHVLDIVIFPNSALLLSAATLQLMPALLKASFKELLLLLPLLAELAAVSNPVLDDQVETQAIRSTSWSTKLLLSAAPSYMPASPTPQSGKHQLSTVPRQRLKPCASHRGQPTPALLLSAAPNYTPASPPRLAGPAVPPALQMAARASCRPGGARGRP